MTSDTKTTQDAKTEQMRPSHEDTQEGWNRWKLRRQTAVPEGTAREAARRAAQEGRADASRGDQSSQGRRQSVTQQG